MAFKFNFNRDTIATVIISLLTLYIVNFIKNIVKAIFLVVAIVISYLIFRNYYPEQFNSKRFEFNENQKNNGPCQIPYNPTRGHELQ
jgi:hypothetical protein